jgi:predicted kinase
MSKEMQHINEQEEDLEMEKGEYPIIDELKKQISPYQELWDLCHEYNEKYLEAW